MGSGKLEANLNRHIPFTSRADKRGEPQSLTDKPAFAFSSASASSRLRNFTAPALCIKIGPTNNPVAPDLWIGLQ
jgi:hypothetical protein